MIHNRLEEMYYKSFPEWRVDVGEVLPPKVGILYGACYRHSCRDCHNTVIIYPGYLASW